MDLRALLGMSVLVSTAACSAEVGAPGERVAEAASAIGGGYVDEADRAVVGIAVEGEGDEPGRSCSGTLLAEGLVLTAQHCVAATAAFDGCAGSEFGAPVGASRVRVTLDARMWDPDTEWLAARNVVLPPGPSVVCGRDLALIVLEHPVESGEAAPIAPRTDRSPTAGQVYSAIGFGASEPGAADAGIRRRRDTQAVQCVGAACGSAETIEDREWRGDDGTCNGDSGGPALDSEGLVIGVTSRGPAGCAGAVYGELSVWSPWISAVAVAAADVQGIAPPTWADPTGYDEPVELPEPPPASDSSSCSFSTRGTALGGAAVWLALGLLAARRRTTPTRKY